MITQSDIGEGDRLGAQMNSFASLKYLSIVTGHEIVFHEEVLKASQGVQLYDVFDIPACVLPSKFVSVSSLMFWLARPFMKNFWVDENFFRQLAKKVFFVLNRLAYCVLRLEHRSSFSVYKAPWGPRIKCDRDLLHSLLRFSKKNVDIPSGRLGSYVEWANFSEIIIRCFKFKDRILKIALSKFCELKDDFPNRTLVAVHCRMTDYLKVSSLNLPDSYYEEAMKLHSSKDVLFVVFTDDVKAASKRPVFQRPNLIYFEASPAISMCVMSLFTHFIISNSSFSFWGAFLSQSVLKTVICPYNVAGEGNPLNGKWFPSDWISIR